MCDIIYKVQECGTGNTRYFRELRDELDALVDDLEIGQTYNFVEVPDILFSATVTEVGTGTEFCLNIIDEDYPGAILYTNGAEWEYQITVTGVGSCPPPIRVLHNCEDVNNKLYTSDLTFDNYIGKIVTLEEYPGCWYVEDELEFAVGESLTITDCYFTCEDCSKVVYQLTDCTGRLQPKYTKQDFESLVGSIIKIPYYGNACFTVSLIKYDQSLIYEELEYSNVYEDCISCKQLKTVEPGEATPRCDQNLIDKVTSNFSTAMHQEVMSKRFGTEFCCLTDKNKWWIKQKMLEFDLAKDEDPELPEPYVESCCIEVEPPCVLPQNNCNTCDPVAVGNTPVDCNCSASVESPHDCHTYAIEITQEMIDDATGNTNTKANNKVYFGYIACGGTSSTTVSFTEIGTEEYCVLGLPILGWFKDNVWVDAEAEFLVRGAICETEN